MDTKKEEGVQKAISALMGAMKENFDEEQKKPNQYVVAYYNSKEELLGYHANTWCQLTSIKEEGKRYNSPDGDVPYKQLSIIRENIDSTLKETEDTAKGDGFAKLSFSIKEKYFKGLNKEDIFIQAEYLDDSISPQRFVWKQL